MRSNVQRFIYSSSNAPSASLLPANDVIKGSTTSNTFFRGSCSLLSPSLFCQKGFFKLPITRLEQSQGNCTRKGRPGRQQVCFFPAQVRFENHGGDNESALVYISPHLEPLGGKRLRN